MKRKHSGPKRPFYKRKGLYIVLIVIFTVLMIADVAVGAFIFKQPSMPEGMSQEEMQMPNGEMPEMPDGEAPEMPDGEIQQIPDGEAPEKPDGEAQDGNGFTQLEGGQMNPPGDANSNNSFEKITEENSDDSTENKTLEQGEMQNGGGRGDMGAGKMGQMPGEQKGIMVVVRFIQSFWIPILVVLAILDVLSIVMLVWVIRKEKKEKVSENPENVVVDVEAVISEAIAETDTETGEGE